MNDPNDDFFLFDMPESFSEDWWGGIALFAVLALVAIVVFACLRAIWG